VLSTRLFDALFGSLPKGLLFDSRGMRTTAPSGVDGKLAIHNTGPFQGIFERLHGLTFAGRNDRPIHLVFTDTDTFHKQDQLHRIAVEQRETAGIHMLDVNENKLLTIVRIHGSQRQLKVNHGA